MLFANVVVVVAVRQCRSLSAPPASSIAVKVFTQRKSYKSFSLLTLPIPSKTTHRYADGNGNNSLKNFPTSVCGPNVAQQQITAANTRHNITVHTADELSCAVSRQMELTEVNLCGTNFVSFFFCGWLLLVTVCCEDKTWCGDGSHSLQILCFGAD